MKYISITSGEVSFRQQPKLYTLYFTLEVGLKINCNAFLMHPFHLLSHRLTVNH